LQAALLACLLCCHAQEDLSNLGKLEKLYRSGATTIFEDVFVKMSQYV
jgi:hypothetical protein